jgi:D-amino-acid dehydrogenase
MGKTVVIGAGAIGLLAAHELRRRGEEVILIDRGEPGAACSSGNLGWIVPASSEPLPEPGISRSLLRWMLSGDGPLFIAPFAGLRMAGWLWRFWSHCNVRDYRNGLEALAALNVRTLELYDSLASEGVGFEMHRTRVLMTSFDETTLDRALDGSEFLDRQGVDPPERLSGAETRELEPALSTGVIGGLLYSEERVVRPESLCAGLATRLTSEGVVMRSGAEVIGVDRRSDRIEAITTTEGNIEADQYLIAAGAWSGLLARRFGFRLPIQAGKGYSITIRNPLRSIRLPLYLQESHVCCSPYDGALRVGGTMEFSGMNARLDRRRISAVRRAVNRFLPDVLEGEDQMEWTGLRAVTTDGLPVIGRAPACTNLYVATGHAMLGITLAAATADAIAALMTEGKSAVDLAPFGPGRF